MCYILCFLSSLLSAQNIEESNGTYDFISEIIQIKAFLQDIANRRIDVWLSDNYKDNQLYKVIYMHTVKCFSMPI